ncbi:MAG: hypothetical protein P8M36_03895 [Gammaproteobacteria bacterium]|nr:hypothetical protein [Gammaproteobacteria bacterium]
MRLISTKDISFKIMLLFGGILASFPSIAHWEGFEAADPSTPSAILRYDSLMGHYKSLEDITVSWPIISSHDTDQVQSDHSNMDSQCTHERHTTEIEQ